MQYAPRVAYDAQKPEKDPDLLEIVRDQMVLLLGAPAVETYFDGHTFVKESKGRHSTIQRLLLSRWFARQLMTAGPRTHDLRPQLAVEDVNLWITVVRETIIPAMRTFELPHTQI